MYLRFDRRLLFPLTPSTGGLERFSGADVTEDSPGRAEKPLPVKPLIVDAAETEVCLVLDPSGLERPCVLRPFDVPDIVGTLRISWLKAGSLIHNQVYLWTSRTENLPRMDEAYLEACTRSPPHVFLERSHELFPSARKSATAKASTSTVSYQIRRI